jgi:formamidopyrimidine-DNA glycosylase
MPEGPEVQTIVNGLRERIVGLTIAGAMFTEGAEGIVAPMSAADFQDAVTGQTVTGVRRRGKFIDIALSSGAHLVIHLMVSGRLIFRDDRGQGERPRFLRGVLEFDNGAELCLADLRKWARVVVLAGDQVETYKCFRDLGVDVLSAQFTFAGFGELVGSRCKIHTLLLDQKRLSGLGNIYANEALFHAGVHPTRPAISLSEAEAMALYYAIRHVTKAALRQKGTTFSDYRTPDGGTGQYQGFLRVYRRAGEPCLRCGTPIERIPIGGRGAYFCPKDQPLGSTAQTPTAQEPQIDEAAAAPAIPLPNHVFILVGPSSAVETLSRQIAASVPFIRLLPAAGKGLIDRALVEGKDALVNLSPEGTRELGGRYPNACVICVGRAESPVRCDFTLAAASPEQALHDAFDIIYAVRCQTAAPPR